MGPLQTIKAASLGPLQAGIPTASDGRRITYGYGPTGQLATVTDPTSATTTYDYDDVGRLTRVVDPDGREVVKATYGEDGRVLTQQFASGESTSYAYDDTAGTTSVTDKSTGSTVVYAHDGSGQLGSLTDPMGARASRTFDPAGDVMTTTARSGATVRQAFDASGNLTGQEIGAAASRFVYDDQDRLIEATDRAGGVIRYGYAGSSRIPSTVTDPLGGVTHLVVEDGRVTQVTDPDGVTSSFTYDPAGNIVASTDGTGATTRFEYDAAGRRVAMISPLGVVERSSYDAAGRLLEATDATGGVTRNRYSPGGLLLETVDPAGARTVCAYDDAGRLTTTTDPTGGVTTYGYDDAGNVTSVTDPAGGVTTFTYDALGRLLSETDPVGGVTRHRYGADGERLSSTDPLGHETRETFDDRGRLVASADAAGAMTRFTYDEADRLVAETDPTGARRSTEYDAAGQVVAEVDPLGATTRRRWTAGSRLAAEEDPLGRVTSYAYDQVGRLTSVTDPGGGVTRYEYNADSRLVTETSAAGLVTRYAYDAAGRRVSETSPRGSVAKTTYSPKGLATAVTRPGGGITRFSYDPAGRLTAAVAANGAETRYGYDPAGRLTSVTDAKGLVTRIAYDRAGRETERTDPLGRTTRRAYDAAGRLVSTVLPTGETIDATYDPVGRVLSRTAGRSVERFAYDAAGRRVHMEDATGTTRYRYDAAGRLGAVVGPDGATVAIGYDAAGQRVSLSYPGGRQVAYAYNSDGRLVSLNETPGGRGAVGPIVEGILPRTVSFRTGLTGEPRKSSGYVLAMRLIAATGPAGERATFEVDADGRLLRETLSSGWTRAYEYQGGLLSSFAETTNGAPLTTRTTRLERDADGRIVAETTAGKTIRYRYDAAGQLVGVDGGPGGPRTFEYDATGNRTASVEGGVTSRYSYDAADQLLRATRGGTATTYSYDAAGRLLVETGPAGTRTTSYEAFGRAARLEHRTGGRVQTRSFTYDGDALLIRLSTVRQSGKSKPEAPVEQRFRWSVADVPQILTETGPDGETDFVYGYDRILAGTATGSEAFSLDLYGSTLATSPTRAWARARGYDVFGAASAHTGPDHADPAFGYRGELTIGDDIYLRARTYDPDTGRFTSPDPLDGVPGEAVAANPYHYANNDPLNQVDPLGLRPRDRDIRAVSRPSCAAGGALALPARSGEGRPYSDPTKPAAFDGKKAICVDAIVEFRPRPDLGIVEARLFIPTPTVGAATARINGDGRGFAVEAHPTRSRAVFRIDYTRGAIDTLINPSCTQYFHCRGAVKISSEFSRWDRWRQHVVGNARNRIRFEFEDGEGIEIHYDVLESVYARWSPHLNGKISIREDAPGRLQARRTGNDFPSFEAYQFVNGQIIWIGRDGAGLPWELVR